MRPESEASTSEDRRARVLVIEDDAQLRGLFCDWLRFLGYEPTGASDGAVGLALLDEGTYDLVLTDLVMPGMSGWDVIDLVRRRRPAQALVMITASATDLDPERLQRSGVKLLRKPISLKDFARAVAEAVGTRSATDRVGRGAAAGPQTSGS